MYCSADVPSAALQGPRCSIRTKKMYSDITVDYLKMTLLNLPAVLLVSFRSGHTSSVCVSYFIAFLSHAPRAAVTTVWTAIRPAAVATSSVKC